MILEGDVGRMVDWRVISQWGAYMCM